MSNPRPRTRWRIKRGARLRRERQDVLRERLRRTDDPRPFRGTDVFSLSATDVAFLITEVATLPWGARRLNLCDANLKGARLEGMRFDKARTDLRGADLQGAHLKGAHLTGLHLEGAHLEGAHLQDARLDKAYLGGEQEKDGAHLDRADLRGAHLDRADLRGTYLEEADIRGAHLVQTRLDASHLRRADLREANLEDAYLAGADLSGVTFDARTNLAKARFGNAHCGGTSIVDAAWNGVNLAAVRWRFLFQPVPSQWGCYLTLLTRRRTWTAKPSGVQGRHPQQPVSNGAVAIDRTVWYRSGRLRTYLAKRSRLGDEPPSDNLAHLLKSRRTDALEDTLQRYQTAVRAYRQLSVTLQGQGLHDQGAEMAYRALRLQRVVLRVQRAVLLAQKRRWRARLTGGQIRINGLLDLVAGYGYKPVRGLALWLSMLCGFLALYLTIALVDLRVVHYTQHIPPVLSSEWIGSILNATAEAAVLSVTSSLGRAWSSGFTANTLAGTNACYALGAMCEGILGLGLEAILVATLVQRYIGKQ